MWRAGFPGGRLPPLSYTQACCFWTERLVALPSRRKRSQRDVVENSLTRLLVLCDVSSNARIPFQFAERRALFVREMLRRFRRGRAFSVFDPPTIRQDLISRNRMFLNLDGLLFWRGEIDNDGRTYRRCSQIRRCLG